MTAINLKNKVKFGELRYKDIFLYNSVVFMKLKEYKDVNAVNLEIGEVSGFHDDMYVEPRDCFIDVKSFYTKV